LIAVTGWTLLPRRQNPNPPTEIRQISTTGSKLPRQRSGILALQVNKVKRQIRRSMNRQLSRPLGRLVPRDSAPLLRPGKCSRSEKKRKESASRCEVAQGSASGTTKRLTPRFDRYLAHVALRSFLSFLLRGQLQQRCRSDPGIGWPRRSNESAIYERSRSNPFGTHPCFKNHLFSAHQN
jgi:hypothetical protein